MNYSDKPVKKHKKVVVNKNKISDKQLHSHMRVQYEWEITRIQNMLKGIETQQEALIGLRDELKEKLVYLHIALEEIEVKKK